jgi:outer membrane protein OmpA-like peptidoglycan-associated protein
MNMKLRLPILFIATILASFTLVGSGCATKKYVRQSVNERVTPLEGRTQELEETVRRNTQDIKSVDDRLSKRIDDVNGRVDKAQASADAANTRASAADEHAGRAEARVEDLRSNLDKYTLLTTGSVHFRLNSSDLNDESKAQLDTLALEAKNHQGYLLEIQGFTDSSGSVSANDELSQERAESVQRYLAKQHQIPVYKMSILGLGKLADDSDVRGSSARREARAKDRRVDVRLLVNNAVSPSGGAVGQQTSN